MCHFKTIHKSWVDNKSHMSDFGHAKLCNVSYFGINYEILKGFELFHMYFILLRNMNQWKLPLNGNIWWIGGIA